MNETLTANLKQARMKKGLTQNRMAEILNISRSTYAAYESGKREPDIYKLLVLANVLETSAEDLIGRAEIDITRGEAAGYMKENPAYSLEDYFGLKEYHDFELLEGQLSRHYDLSYRHQVTNRAITEAVDKNLKPKRGYEVVSARFYVVLSRHNPTIVQPDISVIHDSGCAKHGIYYGAPDIIIETVPEKNKHYDYCEKLYIYHKYGVREFWIVDPEIKRTTVYNLEYDISPIVKSFEKSIPSFVIKGLTLNLEEALKRGASPGEM